MLEALANALLTAYKRMPDAAEEALVEIDMETGEIKVIAQELDEDGNVTREWDDTPTDFGRIAAQTAKQVILQRIREAEREMKYEEYAGREGDIVTGIIQQTDARYTLLDLGKVEALLPQAEQVQNEHYDHGSRLKAYIVEVRKTAKGPQIVVSRTHPGLVKRLFELEVPEIVDGVVELKAIAREPGHRTKLAVSSNDNNVDPVGACVGARGSRVRHGRQRAARREGRHRPLQRRPVRVRDEGARAGEGARGAHPPRHRHRRGHRPRLPAVARDRQGRPERPPRGAAHRLARRHQERDPARGRRVGRRRRVRRGRVGHQRRRRARVAAGRGRRGDLGGRGGLRGAGARDRGGDARRAPTARPTPRRPRADGRRAAPPTAPRRTPRQQRRRQRDRGGCGRRAGRRARGATAPPATRPPRRRRPTASEVDGRDPSAPASGVGRVAAVEELVRIRAVPPRQAARAWSSGRARGGAPGSAVHPAACLDEAQRRRTVDRALRTEVRNDEIERLRARLFDGEDPVTAAIVERTGRSV